MSVSVSCLDLSFVLFGFELNFFLTCGDVFDEDNANDSDDNIDNGSGPVQEQVSSIEVGFREEELNQICNLNDQQQRDLFVFHKEVELNEKKEKKERDIYNVCVCGVYLSRRNAVEKSDDHSDQELSRQQGNHVIGSSEIERIVNASEFLSEIRLEQHLINK
jgi:hypothetical protein